MIGLLFRLTLETKGNGCGLMTRGRQSTISLNNGSLKRKGGQSRGGEWTSQFVNDSTFFPFFFSFLRHKAEIDDEGIALPFQVLLVLA